MTVVIKFTQGSGPVSQTFRNCSSEAEAKAQFLAQPQIKNNPKTVIVEIRSY